MKKLTFSDIVFNVIRFGLIAAIAATVVFHFTTENAVTTITISDIGSSQAAAQNSARISETTASSAAKLINVNTATASQLCSLKGIGEKKAAAIIQYRDEHGDFTSVDQLLNVPGIGEKLLESFRDRITTGLAEIQPEPARTTAGAELSENAEHAESAEIPAETTAAENTNTLINTATAQQLCSLKGIGEKKAAAIIQYRDEHGDFTSVDQLLNVPGIGEKLLESFRDRITTGLAEIQPEPARTTAGAELSENAEHAESAEIPAETTAAENTNTLINTATAQQLCSLKGIGEKKAAAIIQYRDEHGDFTSC